MNRRATRAWAAALLAAVATGAFAHDEGHAKAGLAPAAAQTSPGTHDAQTYFTDTVLVDQHGRHLRFYSDVLRDKVVLLNVVYARCEDACPLITSKLAEVGRKLGERFGTEVFFVSISTDPENDSPEALRKFAAEQKADHPGWTFLTGEKADVDRVLGRLGQLNAEREAHSTLLIAGNVGAKRWSKIQPQAPAWAIVERLKLLAGGPANTAATSER